MITCIHHQTHTGSTSYKYIMAKNTNTYTDIDLNFTRHPLTHDVSAKFNDDAIKGSIRNLVCTLNYERPFHSEIGSRVYSLLFEPLTPVISSILKKEITNLVESFEPRADIIDVIVTYNNDANELNILIVFNIVGTSITSQVNVVLDRTR